MPSKAALVRIAVVGALLVGGAVTATDASAAPVVAHGSVGQVYATGLAPRTSVTLLDAKNHRVATKRATAQGGVLFYEVRPGTGYRLQVGSAKSAPVVVHTDASKPWDTSYQKQELTYDGYGYLTTRDGTKLSYYVHPPTVPAGLGTPDVTLPAGPLFARPYPTLIEYSGYGYANPDAPESSIAALANAMGFAVVDVNMRGTGCSGGAFNFFEALQSLDGYDVIETVARQSWVKGGKVGMMGISYGGISQLFTAQTQPPSLAAIAPVSVIDATPTTLYPGGILNTGFAVAWAKERQVHAEPATGPGHGQAWAYKRIQEGDTTCKDNQALHGEAQDLMQSVRDNRFYENKAYIDSIDPVTFVHKINVPVFMACQWQDEQTGGHCPTLARHFTGTKKKWFTYTNGPHIDALVPETYVRWFDFLQLYVAKQAPGTVAAVTAAASPVVYQEAMGLPQDTFIHMPLDPIWTEPTYESALAAYEEIPSVRVLFDNGAGSGPLMDGGPGDPYSSYDKEFASFPVKGTVGQRWFLGPKGTLVPARSRTKGADVYTSDPKALPLTNFTGGTGGGGLWGNASQWSWNWKNNPAGKAVSYVSAPLAADTTVIGAGAVTAWVKSSAPDVDLQVTVSEVTPDGHETFVQNGYLRASYRKLATGSKTILGHPSTILEPVPSFEKRDNKPMPRNRFEQVTIPLYYQGHAYRKGTRIRITIAAPNGAQPVWSFSEPLPRLGRTSTVTIGYGPTMPSNLVLPVVPGVSIDADQPACPSLRNEPCRPYVPFTNRAVR